MIITKHRTTYAGTAPWLIDTVNSVIMTEAVWKRSPSNIGSRGVRVDHFRYPTRTRSRWCYPYPYPTRAENFYPYPTRPAGIPVPVAYPYDYRTIGLASSLWLGVGRRESRTHPNVIWLHFDCECRHSSGRHKSMSMPIVDLCSA